MVRGSARRCAAWAEDRGASAVEYALMVAAIAAVIVAVVFGLGGFVRDNFIDTCTAIESNPDRPATFADSADC
jgi:pilus assembly protein Flp/PilA